MEFRIRQSEVDEFSDVEPKYILVRIGKNEYLIDRAADVGFSTNGTLPDKVYRVLGYGSVDQDIHVRQIEHKPTIRKVTLKYAESFHKDRDETFENVVTAGDLDGVEE